MYAPQNRTYYNLQDNSDFPLGPLLLPQSRFDGDEPSELGDFCSSRAQPQCAPQPQQGRLGSPPASPSGQDVHSDRLAIYPHYFGTNETSSVHIFSDSDESPHVPPGLSTSDILAPSHGDLTTYCAALHLCESTSWPLDEDFALTGSSGSLQHPLDAQSPGGQRISLSSLKFLGTLGRGGYSKVLLADSSSSLQVAVKVLGKKDMTRDDVGEVKTEVRILRMLAGMGNSVLGAAFTQRMLSAFQTKEHVFMIMVRSLDNPMIPQVFEIYYTGRTDMVLHSHILKSGGNSDSVKISEAHNKLGKPSRTLSHSRSHSLRRHRSPHPTTKR